MKKIRPYLDYLRINFKIYFIIMLAFSIVYMIISLIGMKLTSNDISGSAGIAMYNTSIRSAMMSAFGSLSGITLVYGVILSFTEFNTMLNMRADRNSIIKASTINAIEFLIATVVLYFLYFLVMKTLTSLMIGNFNLEYGYTVIEYFRILFLEITIGLAFGAILYRFGVLKVVVSIILIVSVVILFGVSPSRIMQDMMYSGIYYIEVIIENYYNIAILLIGLLMYTIYYLLMRKAPLKEYSKKSIFKLKM